VSTILVVDDMPIFRDPIAASLRLAGFATVCAANGREALAAAAAHRPDVILLDVAMPVMDGIACLRGLRADPELAKTPVILLTAMSDKRYVVEAGKLGVHDYLLKSAFSMQELLTRVYKYVERPAKPGGKQVPKPDAKSDAGAGDGAKGKQGTKPVAKSAAIPAGKPETTPARPPAAGPAAANASRATTPTTSPAAGASPAPKPAPAPAQSGFAPATPAAIAALTTGVGGAESTGLTRLLTREQCVARAEKAMGAKTLSGAVAEVIRLAASPRSNVNDLAPLISRDPMLSARVLQAANSAAYVSSRGVVSNIPDAVRQVGTSTVRQIASALGIFDAMPPSEPDGFNPVRCWQHSFAVAMLCERLSLGQKENARDAAGASAQAAPPGIAYLVGLCHDLGEILFHTHFAKEYAQVLEVQARGGRNPDDVERQMLGMTRGELVQTIVKCLGLPEQIKEPIGAFHGTSAGAGAAAAPLVRVLKAAEWYANGLLLASSVKAPVAPLTRAECRAAVGRDDPPAPDATAFRSEVLYTTGVLARMSAAEAEDVMKPPFGRSDARLWVVRESSLSALDPVTAALESLAHVTPRERLPEAIDADGIDGLVVVAPSDLTAGLTAPDIAKALVAMGKSVPVLWLVARATFSSPPPATKGRPQAPAPARWPVGIDRLAAFVGSCAGESGHAAAA
jgi:CheY-like chemotaxis protein/HD-like signal output (HDOD) protein